MTDAPDRWTDEGDDAGTMRLLRLAGPRVDVPEARAARVRAAVHAEWRIVARRRAVRRRVVVGATFLAAAAALVLTIDRVDPVDRRVAPLGEPVANVEQTDGIPRRSDPADGSTSTGLSSNDTVRAGEWIETDAGARVALRFADGTSVRLDVGSRARALSSSAIELSAGAAYVDTGGESGRFEVRTAMATARDVGTQFEVRLLEGTLRLRVRTGVVELADRERAVSGRAGTEIMLSATGAATRPIPAYGPEWDWTGRVAPPLEMEGMTLAAFLERAAREQGWVVQYATPTVAGEGARIILHGSVNGLAPTEAVEVATTTSGLRHRLERGELTVRADDTRERN